MTKLGESLILIRIDPCPRQVAVKRAQISRLQQAKVLLTDTFSLTHAKRKPLDAKPRKRRGMSAAGRARIAAAQKARWVRFKKVAQ
jgi:hypothetical protein